MKNARSFILFAIFSLVPLSSASSQEAKVVAQFTLHVIKAPETRQFPNVNAMKGIRTMALGSKENGKTFEAPLDTYVLVRFPEDSAAQAYSVNPLHGVLESPSGLLHMPMNVMGVLRAVKEGTATITVKAVPRGPLSHGVVSGGSISSNWSGYAITGGPFSFIQGQWRVPTVQVQGGTEYSSTWVGIDGLNNGTVLQVGTEQDNSCCIFPPSYSAWYELFPANPVSIPDPVSPGDLMVAMILPQAGASATVTPGLPATWTISLNNVTKGWVFSTEVSYTGMLSSAEWIEEAPGTCSNNNTVCTPLPLADYGSVAFDIQDFTCPPTGKSTCPPNAMGSPSFTTNESLTIVQSIPNPPGEAVFSTPSNPDGDADGFTVSYSFGVLSFPPGPPPPPGPVFFSSALPNAVLGQPYSQSLAFAQDCSPQWSIVGGSLPPGLALGNPTSNCSTGFGSGPVTGTPTSAGAFLFTVDLTDGNNPGATTTQAIALNVMESPPPPDFSLSASPAIIKQRHTAGGCIGGTVISVIPLNGFAGRVQLTPPANDILGISFSPNPTSGASTLTIPPNPCDGWPAGITITGTSGSLSHTLNIGTNAPRCGGPGEPPCP